MTARSSSRWRFMVTDLTNAILGELPLRQVKWEQHLNKPATLTGTLKMSEAQAIRTLIDPARRKVWALRDGVAVYGGIIWTVEHNTKQDSLRISTADDFSYFYTRFIDYDITWYGGLGDQLDEIVYGLLDLMQDEGTYPGGDVSLTTYAGGYSGEALSEVWALKAYERHNVGKIIEKLAATSVGFDFGVTAAGSVSAGFTNTFRCYTPWKGTASKFRWSIKQDEPGNTIVDLQGSESAELMVNNVTSIGAGEGDAMLIEVVNDATSIALGYPRLEDVISNKDMTTAELLQSAADEFLRLRMRPPRTYKAELRRDHTDTSVSAFDIGDRGTLEVDWGHLLVDDPATPWRVISRTVGISDKTGEETVDVTLQEVLAEAGA